MKLTQRMYGRGGLSTALGFLKSDRGKGILKTVAVEGALAGISMLPADVKGRVVSRLKNKEAMEKMRSEQKAANAQPEKPNVRDEDVFYDTVSGDGSKRVNEKKRRAIMNKLINF